MTKKKIGALLICATLAVGVVGGTFAWFTSSDSVTNKFATGSVEDPNGNGPDAGIKIEENFPNSTDGIYNDPVVPGKTMTKEVKVASTANYDQFLRAKITKVWYMDTHIVKSYKEVSEGVIEYYGDYQVEVEGVTTTKYYSVVKNSDGTFTRKELTSEPSEVTLLDYDKIDLVLGTDVEDYVEGKDKGDTWTNIGDLTSPEKGYFYYDQILQEMGYDESKNEVDQDYTDITTLLLATVTLKNEGEIDNYYKNLTFDVIIEAEGVQASNGAAGGTGGLGWSTLVPAASIDGYQN